ncbi:tetratricopeptide repeat protein [Desulfovibrio sp. SGI.169]|uniref:tetratricopeptide repeat protein n=1 Tax=Desulfovibrio sp. SGI.169 TaxID=3420561 RepID=UPI003D03981F
MTIVLSLQRPTRPVLPVFLAPALVLALALTLTAPGGTPAARAADAAQQVQTPPPASPSDAARAAPARKKASRARKNKNAAASTVTATAAASATKNAEASAPDSPPLSQGKKTSDQLPERTPPLPEGPAGDAARAYTQGDFLTARDIWQKLARQGDGQAMNNLGVLYDQGQGVEPDTGRALHWFAQSARAGHPSGMSNYGRMLEQGRGMPANPAEAARWFDLAARQGQAEAQYNLGLLYERGRGVPRDDKAAAAWYSRAAAQQQTEALARLGHFYRVGRGVQKNPSRAALLLYAAAMNGADGAIRELEEMAKEGPARPAAVLFGQKLDNTDRAAMRAALKKAGTPASRESDDFICDLYDVRRAAPGAEQMAVCYGPGAAAPLGFLKIDYAAPDKATAGRILDMVKERFGPPSAGEGDDARLWNLGSVVVATQYAPTHRQMSLMYMVPRVYHLTRRP